MRNAPTHAGGRAGGAQRDRPKERQKALRYCGRLVGTAVHASESVVRITRCTARRGGETLLRGAIDDHGRQGYSTRFVVLIYTLKRDLALANSLQVAMTNRPSGARR